MPDFSNVKVGDSLVYVLPGRKPEQQEVIVTDVSDGWITCRIPGNEEDLVFYLQTGEAYLGRDCGYLEPKKETPRTR